MTTDIEVLRSELAELYTKHHRGDVAERCFQQEVAQLTVLLYRTVIKQRLTDDELIECEHHTIRTHFSFTQSVLQEPDQGAISLFLTNRKLYRLQSTVMPYQPPTADSRDHTSVDEISFDSIKSLKKKLQIRVGEILVGTMFGGVAMVFYDWLAITGPVLIGLGGLGVLHALILPTRWIEVSTADLSSSSDPIIIYAVGRKSAKQLVRELREKLSNTNAHSKK